MKFPKFKIGLMADMFGVTPETIRHYERRKMISPSETKNRYRYYDMPASGEVAAIRLYRSYGYTLEEIDEILHTTHLNEIADKLEVKAQEIEKEIQKKLELLRSVRKQQSNIYRAGQTEYIKLETRPAFYYADIYEYGHIIDSEESCRLCAIVLDCQPFGAPFVRYTLDELKAGATHTSYCGVAIPCEDWKRLRGTPDPSFQYIPECLAIHTVLRMEPYTGPVIELFDDVFAFAEKNDFVIDGDILATTAASYYSDEIFCYYRDVWIPVKRK